MNKLLLTLIIFAISTSAFGQQAFSSLEEQMKGQEFKAAGLDKLTPDELDSVYTTRRAVFIDDTNGPDGTVIDLDLSGNSIAGNLGDAETDKLTDL